MGKDLALQHRAAREIFREADSVLGISISGLMWEGPEAQLNDTINTQPGLFIHSLATHAVFAEMHPSFAPACMAGHSLGELSALTVAGAISFEDGLRLVRRRGELMKRAGELSPGSMAAVIGLDAGELDDVCAAASTGHEIVQVANDNCPGQVVISGAQPAVERALELAKANGAKRVVRLAVSIAAHSPLMKSIQEDWNATVQAASINPTSIPVVGNVHARPLVDPAAARSDLMDQMQMRVRWTESIEWMVAKGIRSFVEVGSGTVLGGLIRRIAKDAAVISLGNPRDFQKLE